MWGGGKTTKNRPDEAKSGQWKTLILLGVGPERLKMEGGMRRTTCVMEGWVGADSGRSRGTETEMESRDETRQ